MPNKQINKLYIKLYNHFSLQHWWPASSKNKQFEIIIGTILTQNTSWKNVEKAISNLRENNALNRESIQNLPKTKLAQLIKPSGYFNQKAKKLKLLIEFLNSKKPVTRDSLLSIWGIGPETADSILLYAFNKPYFVIDSYTKRIMNRLGFKESSYEELQSLFTSNLPKDYKIYNEYHALLVRLGKDICIKKPKCHLCPLKNNCSHYRKIYT
jgi:endonuclease III related protein